MARLSIDALKILRKCRELGFANEGEAIQARSYTTEFDSIDKAKAAHQELVNAGMCEASNTHSVKLTTAGAQEAQTA